MGQTPENKVKGKLKRALRSAFPGCYITSPIGSAFGHNGTPDLVCCLRGKFIGIEVKARMGMEPTVLQRRALDDIGAAGGWALVCDGPEAVDALVFMLKRAVFRD